MPLWSCPHVDHDALTGTLLLFGYGTSAGALTFTFSPVPFCHFSTAFAPPISTSLSSVMKKACRVYHHALSSQRASH